MNEQTLNLNGVQIVSGTDIMEAGEGGAHTRGLTVFVPGFASRPNITVSIYTPEREFLKSLDRCKPKSEDEDQEIGTCGNQGQTFSPWAIEYIPQVLGNKDQITISAANAETGLETGALFLCSYVAIGVPI
jgi:hypothetical protein